MLIEIDDSGSTLHMQLQRLIKLKPGGHPPRKLGKLGNFSPFREKSGKVCCCLWYVTACNVMEIK